MKNTREITKMFGLVKNRYKMNIFVRIKTKTWVLKYIIPTIYFNFHYLPFCQAIKLPIWLYKPTLVKCGGKVVLRSGGVRPGMITLGKYRVTLYPNSGFSFENHGILEFHGRCTIGNNSFVSIGETGHVVIGDNVSCTSSLKLTSYHRICLDNNVLIGWNNTIMDTDFHRLKYVDGSPSPKSFGQIIIGEGTWIGANAIIMKGTIIPPFCVIASNSLLNKKYDCAENTLFAGQPAKAIKTGIYMDRNDDKIDYKL